MKAPVEGATFAEPHLSVEDIAELWKLSRETVTRLFENEPGTVVFWRQQPGRRIYRTLRVPESVAARVHRRMARA
jgi:transcriptional regulator GlxA family with amidase domain